MSQIMAWWAVSGAGEVARLPIMTVAIREAAAVPTPPGLHITETTGVDPLNQPAGESPPDGNH
ncbi:hypothetical protein [Micromonospora sp. LH3U1]|uniref:hypothetical protein n=1 Tax=Micromonospora sp. LH3U1 TaxID=3018339 RepID=UPI00234B9DC8|nr:hypothetical protein [Micromonospora sp. LH3U1]WCN83076.1 hypothetical protein PCA76_08475 [Micromonospora sp. LH3U1]